MFLGYCWQNDVWEDGSWQEDVWCPEPIIPCISDIIGNVWVQTSWEADAWCQGTWANRVVPPTPVVTIEQRRWPGPPIVLYDEREVLKKIKRKKRENEEIIIL